MAQSTKLNKVGNQVVSNIKEACSCWNDVEFFNEETSEVFYWVDITQRSRRNIGSNLTEKVLSILEAFETAGICNTLCTIEAMESDGKIFPYLHVAISLN